MNLIEENNVRGKCGCKINPGQWIFGGFTQFGEKLVILDYSNYSPPKVVICIFTATREMTKEFMQAVSLAGIKTHEFVYILPWLQAEAKDASPWIGADGQMIQNVKEFFTGSIIVGKTIINIVTQYSLSD